MSWHESDTEAVYLLVYTMSAILRRAASYKVFRA